MYQYMVKRSPYDEFPRSYKHLNFRLWLAFLNYLFRIFYLPASMKYTLVCSFAQQNLCEPSEFSLVSVSIKAFFYRKTFEEIAFYCPAY